MRIKSQLSPPRTSHLPASHDPTRGNHDVLNRLPAAISSTLQQAFALASQPAVLPAKCADAVQATLYVAPDGRDKTGTIERPFQTIDPARQEVRKIDAKMTGDIVVALRGGTYSIQKTIAFDAADSGDGGHDVIYRAAKETP